MFYIVMAGDRYYPSDGPRDWKLSTTDKQMALDFASKGWPQKADWCSVVEIDTETLEWREIWYND